MFDGSWVISGLWKQCLLPDESLMPCYNKSWVPIDFCRAVYKGEGRWFPGGSPPFTCAESPPQYWSDRSRRWQSNCISLLDEPCLCLFIYWSNIRTSSINRWNMKNFVFCFSFIFISDLKVEWNWVLPNMRWNLWVNSPPLRFFFSAWFSRCRWFDGPIKKFGI